MIDPFTGIKTTLSIFTNKEEKIITKEENYVGTYLSISIDTICDIQYFILLWNVSYFKL